MGILKVLVTGFSSWCQPAWIREETLESGNLVFSSSLVVEFCLCTVAFYVYIIHIFPNIGLEWMKLSQLGFTLTYLSSWHSNLHMEWKEWVNQIQNVTEKKTIGKIANLLVFLLSQLLFYINIWFDLTDNCMLTQEATPPSSMTILFM